MQNDPKALRALVEELRARRAFSVIPGREIPDGLCIRAADAIEALLDAAEGEAKPVAFMVAGAMIPHQPVKAKGRYEDPTTAIYPAEREADAREAARILRADCTPLYASPVVPEGWRLVPVEPTEAMVEAHFAAHARAETVFADTREVWQAMLFSAPLPQKGKADAPQGGGRD